MTLDPFDISSNGYEAKVTLDNGQVITINIKAVYWVFISFGIIELGAISPIHSRRIHQEDLSMKPNQTRSDLVAFIQQNMAEYPAYQVKEMVNFLLNDIVALAMQGRPVVFTNLGALKQVVKRGGLARNPRTNEPHPMSPRKCLTFKFVSKLTYKEDNV